MMKKFLVCAVVAFFVITFTISNVYASLVFDEDITVLGTGLGNVNTLVTGSDVGAGANGTESFGINQNGSFTVLADGFGIQGGDNQAINNVLTFSTDHKIAAVVNINEPGNDAVATMTNLYLTFSNGNLPGNDFTASFTGSFVSDAAQANSGTGGSGFVFVVDDAQWVTVLALGPEVTVSGGIQFAEGTATGGIDTVYVIQVEGGKQVVPVPAAAWLLGSGLIGLVAIRRRFKN